jgi:hypothetical protein
MAFQEKYAMARYKFLGKFLFGPIFDFYVVRISFHQLVSRCFTLRTNNPETPTSHAPGLLLDVWIRPHIKPITPRLNNIQTAN